MAKRPFMVNAISDQSFTTWDFEGPVVAIIDRLQQLVDEYGEEVKLDYVDDSATICATYAVRYSRPETEEEKKARLARRRERREIEATLREERRKQYEELKKEFDE